MAAPGFFEINIVIKVMEHLTKEGYLDKDGEVVQNPMMDELFLDNEAITLASTCSIAGKIAFGVNAGKYRVCRAGEGEQRLVPVLATLKKFP